MDEPSLRAQLATLEASRSSLHSSFRHWEWIVVAGIVLELVVLVKEYCDGWRAYHRATIRLPEKPNTLLFALGVLGISMVAGGISKELGIDSQIERVETQIRGVNEQLFGIVSQEAQEAALVSSAAKSDANTAHDESDEAKASAKTAGELATSAKSDVRDARQETARLKEENTELANDLLSTKTQLGVVDARRAELEQSLRNFSICNAPRVLQLWTLNNKNSIDGLKPFERSVLIEFLPDFEVGRAASNIAEALKQAGWDVKISPLNGAINDGVEVQPYRMPTDSTAEEMRTLWPLETASRSAAEALVDFLHSYNWQAKIGSADDTDAKKIPLDGLRIAVGLYPAVTYIAPPGAKELKDWLTAREKQQKEQMERRQKEENQRDEKRFKNLTPEQIAKIKTSTEEWNKRMMLDWERFAGTTPCQPLESLTPHPQF